MIMAQTGFTQSRERGAPAMSGWLMLLLGLALGAFGLWSLINDINHNAVPVLGIASLVTSILILAGLYTLQPNESVAILQFGQYMGTDRAEGLRWVFFWMTRKKVSLRVRNATSDTLKVNDLGGNPIEIATNVVWRVENTAQALFDVDDYESFAAIEIDTALRDIAAHFHYDHAEPGEPTLRGDAEHVAQQLTERLRARLAIGGMAVDEARISHLAYAPEIAGAMLKRQQAEAVLAARAKIVTGAVTMVESALHQLSERSIVTLDEERKAAMVSNLLVVLCADREAQPVVNTGTLYG
jgi:regulator of protease activity HflC (stomatin/prohibitin superfamily)